MVRMAVPHARVGLGAQLEQFIDSAAAHGGDCNDLYAGAFAGTSSVQVCAYARFGLCMHGAA